MVKVVTKASGLSGKVSPPGDKSITHRAIMLLSLADGEASVYNYLDCADTRMTIQAFEKMGVKIIKEKNRLLINGVGMEGLEEPRGEIFAGNSGTTLRLLSGILAAQNFRSIITGDESLSKRPMRRIIEPLRKMGASITGRDENFPPIEITGNKNITPIDWRSEIASAQVKSCILFAGMFAKGITSFQEPFKSRDHTERMLRFLGARLYEDREEKKVYIEGPTKLRSRDIDVPSDFSSAAYFIVAALLVPNSRLRLEGVNMNPTRIGMLNLLKRAGAKIEVENFRIECNEPRGDIIVSSSNIEPLKISSEIIPSIIDEIPVLAVALTQSNGRSEISGARELRHKESDRIKSTYEGLRRMGADIIEKEDGFIINGPVALKGAKIRSYRDHRIAMAFAIAGILSDGETIIEEAESVEVSFPTFWDELEKVIKR